MKQRLMSGLIALRKRAYVAFSIARINLLLSVKDAQNTTAKSILNHI